MPYLLGPDARPIAVHVCVCVCVMLILCPIQQDRIANTEPEECKLLLNFYNPVITSLIEVRGHSFWDLEGRRETSD